ncbi:protein kinase [Streptosporangiaceae bacterium NEAU-GS5]|nr:protein kinase [Streptosporangiaceae bacterium NEAU-GS5]
MSVIWRAFDQSLQRTVAIKVLDGELAAEHPGRELIRREARATARLIHPDAIEVYDYGETVTPRGRLAAFVVMRLLEGRSLADRVAEGPIPWPEATSIAAKLAMVLAAAHDRGIVHRDVTPENVLLTSDGAKLLDFGIAAFAGEADDQLVADFGTPPYVAPERLKGLTADPAVDVYSLGVLLFEMLKGTPPYPETTWEAIEQARREGPPPMPTGIHGLPSEVAALCARCLDTDPAARPSARHVATVLSMALRIKLRRTTSGWRGAGWGRISGWVRPPGSHRTDAHPDERNRAEGSRLTLAHGRLRWSAGAAVLVTAGLFVWVFFLWTRPGGNAPRGQAAAPPTPRPSTQPSTGPSRQQAAQPYATVTTTVTATSRPTRVTEPVIDPSRQATAQPQASATAHSPRPPSTAGPTSTSTAQPTHEAGVAPLPLATTAAPPTLDEAVARFSSILDAGVSAGAIAPDAAQDLRSELRNAVNNHSITSLDNIRLKLSDRVREGTLSTAYRDKLIGALKDIETALRSQGA